MKFNDAQAVEQITYEMKLSDWPRALNRKRINELFNGYPPYTDEEVAENHINVNVNSLEPTKLSHDARAQFYGAFLKPGNYFNASTDSGPAHKRGEWNSMVTGKINKIMKRSLDYFETHRSKFAMDVLHGIGPAAWRNRQCWAPDAVGIEDVMIPSSTLLTMRNLPFFAIYRSLTAPELIRLTRGPNVDSAWNLPLVKRCLEWIDRESTALMGSNWPEVWSPEKAAERVKGDGGFYAGDQVPTIDCWDFYFWSDEYKQSGWRRRIILDSWSTPASAGTGYQMSRRSSANDSRWDYGKGEFLYNSGARVFADNFRQVISFQFADLSAVAPFKYHSVRSLGYLLYAVGHLQNRMRCKFSEAVFEALMMYFRVKSTDDAERALKVELANKGFIDDSLQFVPASERFQVNAQLVELGLSENERIIQDHASSWTANKEAGGSDKTQKTKFQVMAELNAMTTLVQASLLQAYCYQKFEYNEIFRRFCQKNSSDPDVREFRVACLSQGIPPSILVPEAWEIEPERVMGSGNKTMEMAISEQLMQIRPLLDPEPQRTVLRDVIGAFTDDAARARALVPENPMKVTDSVHDAQLCFTRLMEGYPVALKTGINHVEYIESMLMDLEMTVNKFKQQGNLADMKSIIGMQTVAQNIAQHLQVMGQDPAEKERVREYGQKLSVLMNEVKGFMQRLEQMMKKQQQAQGGNGQGMDPKDAAKIQAIQLTAKTKAEVMQKSHAERTAQKRINFEEKLKQDQEKSRAQIVLEAHRHGMGLQQEQNQHALDIRKKNLELASNLANDRLKRSLMESDAEEEK